MELIGQAGWVAKHDRRECRLDFRDHWIRGELVSISHVIDAEHVAQPSGNAERDRSQTFGAAIFFQVGFDCLTEADTDAL